MLSLLTSTASSDNIAGFEGCVWKCPFVGNVRHVLGILGMMAALAKVQAFSLG
jgi:hypothetical protein